MPASARQRVIHSRGFIHRITEPRGRPGRIVGHPELDGSSTGGEATLGLPGLATETTAAIEERNEQCSKRR